MPVTNLSIHEAKPEPVVSVVVLSYNSQKTIRASLGSLARQKTSFPFEVIVVDSSRDRTASIVRNEYPWVRLVQLARRALPGETRNVGVQHARGSIITFLASDCVADPDWLQIRMESHCEGFAAVGGVITNANPGNVVGWANYLIEYVFCLPNRAKEVIRGKIIHNLSYRRELFDRYGLFPPDLPLGEDTVFNRKLMVHNEAVLFNPDIRTGHLNPSSLIHLLKHHYEHGKYFMRACRNGELTYFGAPDKIRPNTVYATLFVYPWMRVKNCVNFVLARNRSLVMPLLLSFPFLVLGIYSAGWGALMEVASHPTTTTREEEAERAA